MKYILRAKCLCIIYECGILPKFCGIITIPWQYPERVLYKSRKVIITWQRSLIQQRTLIIQSQEWVRGGLSVRYLNIGPPGTRHHVDEIWNGEGDTGRGGGPEPPPWLPSVVTNTICSYLVYEVGNKNRPTVPSYTTDKNLLMQTAKLND